MRALVDVDAERCVLGLLLCAAGIESVATVRDALARTPVAPEDFAGEPHAPVLREMLALLAEGAPCNVASVWGRTKGLPGVVSAGGLKWLTALSASGESLLLTSLPEHARLLRDLAARRRLTAIGRQLVADAADPHTPPSTAVANASKALEGVTTRPSAFRTLRQIGQECVDELNSGVERIIPTGIVSLDRVIGGLPPTLIVVGGRPGAGKSAFCATLVQNLAQAKYRVGVFSLEDEAKWLGWRLLSAQSGVSNHVLRSRELTDVQHSLAGTGFAKMMGYADRVYVDDREGLSAQDIVEAARRAILVEGVQVVIVDHLGELKQDGDKFERHDLALADALTQLRGIAKRYGVPVVVCAQLNRKADEKPGEEPRLSQFKNAGAIEEKARVALGLCREMGSDTLGICVLKNTNGIAGKRIDVTFHGAAAMIRSVEGAANDLRVVE